MARHRRSRSKYKKLSDAVFSKTGLPLSRLLSIVIGLLIVGGIVAYAFQADNKSSASAPESHTSQFNSNGSEEQNFLEAGTLPPDYQTLPLPVQLEKIDSMILHCRHLISKDNDYKDEIKEKMISLHALKCITMSQNNLPPTTAVEQLEAVVSQVVASEAEREKYNYLLAFVHMANLALLPESEQYDKAVSAINSIDESTPVLPAKAAGCYNSALLYYKNSKDKVAATKLLQLLGSKMAMAEEKTIAEMGLSLIDYPTFSKYIRQSILESEKDDSLISKTDQLLNLMRKTPPQSENTYDVLLQLPEHYLQTGNSKTAAKVLKEIESAAAGLDERFRDKLQPKINNAARRISLLGKPFPLTGTDASGKPLRPTEKKQTVVVFWSPRHKRSLDILAQLRDSSIYDVWTTNLIIATASDLTPEEFRNLEKLYSPFRFVDFQTSKKWMLEVGVSTVPYLMTVNKNGIVERFSNP